jgi:CheY-like chemotaxis protein
LSVADEPGILVSRQLILESEGYEVLSSADGEQALRMFAGQPVDLVLLDYVMPGMNGGVVAREMKIGIGAAVTRRPLPHHRAYGSVHGGSSWLR